MAYSQLKLLSFSATPFSDSSLEEKTKQKKIKRKEKIGWNQKSYCFRTGQFISDLKLFIMIEHFCPKKKAYKITITFSNTVVQFAFSPLAH